MFDVKSKKSTYYVSWEILPSNKIKIKRATKITPLHFIRRCKRKLEHRKYYSRLSITTSSPSNPNLKQGPIKYDIRKLHETIYGKVPTHLQAEIDLDT